MPAAKQPGVLGFVQQYWQVGSIAVALPAFELDRLVQRRTRKNCALYHETLPALNVGLRQLTSDLDPKTRARFAAMLHEADSLQEVTPPELADNPVLASGYAWLATFPPAMARKVLDWSAEAILDGRVVQMDWKPGRWSVRQARSMDALTTIRIKSPSPVRV